MYFQTLFPVPSLKQLSAKFLHHRDGLRSFCSIPNLCHHWSLRGMDKFCPGSFPLWQSREFCLLLALTSPNIEKAYNMGIIRIYRSSVTHWCKFDIHTLCCSHDRAVLFSLFSQRKQLHLKKSCFTWLKQEKQLYLGNNTTYEHQTCHQCVAEDL